MFGKTFSSFTFGLMVIFLLSCNNATETPIPIEKIYEGSLIRPSVSDLENFYQEGYTSITGHIRIQDLESTEIHQNLHYLSNLKHIGGSLELVSLSEVEDLEGLNQLDSVSGSLSIVYCHKLRNMEGLDKLSHIGMEFKLNLNESLIDLQGLEFLSSIGMKLKLAGNHQMLSLKGLNNLETIGGTLEIGEYYGSGNDKLESIEALSNLETLDHRLDIHNNASLQHLAGLENMLSVWRVDMTNNSILSDFCALESMVKNEGVDGPFELIGNAYNPTAEDIKAGNCSQ